MRPKDAWLATQGQLELQLSQATYDTWVRDCKFISYENGIFTISVRNAYVKDWLEHRLYRSIRHTLSDVFRHQIDVHFVVSNPVSTPPAPQWEVQPRPELPLNLNQAAAMPTPHYDMMPPSPPSMPMGQNFDWGFSTEEAEWNPNLKFTNTFETFVVGSSNQMAQAAAQAVSRAPGEIYNPLFIYGDVGLGKTHLLHAIGNACHQRGLKVLYTTSEEFTNDLVESIRNKTTADFREQYRHVDVLLIDDVQFIAGKESTQEEFFHTFNALHGHRKQVVIAADRPPSQMRGLEKRLVSRLEWGLQVDIQAPSYETRLAIVRDKSEMQGHLLPEDVAEFVAQHKGNIRELEGMITQLIAYTSLMQIRLNLDVARRILHQKGNNDGQQGTARPLRDKAAVQRRLSLEQVIEETAHVLQLQLTDLISKSRTKEISNARQWAIYVAREETQASWPEIGGALGGRNHSTMLYSYNKIAEQVASDPEMRAQYDRIRQHLRNASSN